MIRYEYPLNERIRLLLRLEDLFDRLAWYVQGEHIYHHHSSLLTLFELADVASHSDLKAHLLQELERQRTTLSALRGNPDVEQVKLEAVLQEIDAAHAGIHQMAGKVGQHLKDDEWLMTVKQRAVIPGGLCEFDLPSYHLWLNADSDTRREDLYRWLAPMLPIRAGLGIVLRLMRESCRSAMQQAINGIYQQMLDTNIRPPQMIRIGIDDGVRCIPEISANKYMLNIRFVRNEPGQSKVCAGTLPFELTFCTL